MFQLRVRPLRPLFLSLLTVLLATPAGAIIEHGAGASEARARDAYRLEPWVLSATDSGFSASMAAQDPAYQAFLESAGGTWWARYDRRTGRPSMIWGSGLPWLPGRGNDLTWAHVTGETTQVDPPSHEEILRIAEAKARQFIDTHADLFRVPEGLGELVVDDARSGWIDDGRIVYLTLRPEPNGVPVYRSNVFFRLNSGNVTQFGTELMGDVLSSVPTVPAVNDITAFEIIQGRVDEFLRKYFAGPDGKEPPRLRLREIVDEGTLRVLPWVENPRSYAGLVGEGIGYRLAWRVAFRLEGFHHTWAGDVDAVTGEVLTVFDRNKYQCVPPAVPQGRVTGGVFLGAVEEVPETVRGMPWALVENGSSITADYNGLYPYTVGTPAETGLNGTFFNMNCEGCNNPAQAYVRNEGWGNLYLGMGGEDENGNGFSTQAERNCYYHLNVVRQIASKHMDDADVGGFFNRNVPARVNIDDSCNAFYDGNGVNFFRSSGACNNTGNIAEVMQHEWGHALDDNTGGISDGARSEGLSDVVAFLSTHDPRLGPYFNRGNPNGIRHADETDARSRAFPNPLTAGNVGTECPGGGGPLGGQVHCEGQIVSQVFWRLAQSMIGKYGDIAGWFATERLFYQSLPLSDTHVGNQPGSNYDAVVMVDDDDGNLANGTPNATEINDSFVAHEVESTPIVGDSADCTEPAAPTITLTDRQNAATGLWQVQVDWTPVAGAVEYLIVRNDQMGIGADVPVATIFPPATQFIDDNVTDGVDYRYRVMVLDANGCASRAENAESVTVGALVSLGLESFIFDDSAGNVNGMADPGETFSLVVRIRNIGSLLARNIVGTLSSTHPGVSFVDDGAAFGTLAADDVGQSGAPHFIVTLDAGLVNCGDLLPFTLALETPDGCSYAGFILRVGELEGFDASAEDDFEADRGWVVDPQGADPNLTSGGFERADPGPFGVQLGDDHTPGAGTMCWVTDNQDGGGPGAFDVDGGCTVIQSPVYDLGGIRGLELSYWRYYSIGTSFDDEFVAEISNDGGNAWMDLERLAGSTNGWEEGVFDLDSVLGGPANRVVVRITVCDTAPGSLIEAQVDDFSLRAPRYNCEDPRPQATLELDGARFDDTRGGGGSGNGNGYLDPGEVVKVIVDLGNTGNDGAVNVSATLTLVSGPAGTSVSDPNGQWPPIAVGQTQSTGVDVPPHFEVTVPDGIPCEGEVELLMTVTYETAIGTKMLEETIRFPIGFEDIRADDDFETADDNGWTHGSDCGGAPGCDDQDDWQHQPPAATSPFDTGVAVSGAQVWGNDLGTGNWNGDYRPNVNNWLESPSVDCSGMVGARLGFWRWLTVEDAAADQASILVNGTQIWQNPVGMDLIDAAWVYQEYDISALADGVADVRVRFTLVTNDNNEFGGWTIDDFRIFAPRTCESSCIVPFTAAASNAGPLDCDGNPADLLAEVTSGGDGSMGFTYEWSPPTVADPRSDRTTTTVADTYTCVITDVATGCAVAVQTTVDPSAMRPSAEAGADQVSVCFGDVTLTGRASDGDGSMGYEYFWEPAAQVDDPTSPTPTTNEPGVYTLTVTDLATGCTAQDTVTVIDPGDRTPPPVIGNALRVRKDAADVVLDLSRYSWLEPHLFAIYRDVRADTMDDATLNIGSPLLLLRDEPGPDVIDAGAAALTEPDLLFYRAHVLNTCGVESE